ncbi:hypothetical protein YASMINEVIRUS_148 [Yasminevirus sp. GU-2018]|uniref:Uncharacterized protein n=1 Tax=Yasminevirus sp. GU-2018 TaxID=2420051 RepID=A0A5K0U7B3_9VIRU|nr:hypothetical protein YASMINEVIRUS_148 [Yasminevirus sp. GU-2018]
MCRRTTCSICKKATWSGCGSHVAQVMRGVKEEDRCKCRDKKSTPSVQPSQQVQQTQPVQTQNTQQNSNQEQNPFQNPAIAPRPINRSTNRFNGVQSAFFIPPSGSGSSGFPGRH